LIYPHSAVSHFYIQFNLHLLQYHLKLFDLLQYHPPLEQAVAKDYLSLLFPE